ncbi:MAG: B12-binding domain-containing radical SAM protein [Proteobacteria bacterium]|nr:B12-binding domain-containing radical SAM protein [Pseudomonadota bacterium]
MKTMPNVLFVNLLTLPLDDVKAVFYLKSIRTQSVSMPMGILYLSAAAKKADCVGEVGIIDYVLELGNSGKYSDMDAFIEGVAKKSAKFEPDVLAFSLNFSASHAFFTRTFCALHKLWPKAVTIPGGVHASNIARHLFTEIDIDYVAFGECETSFVDFLREIGESSIVNIQGIYSRRKLPEAGHVESANFVDDLDTLAFPDWGLIDMDRYIVSLGRQRDIGKVQKHASLITTRGCYFRCTFCSAHTVHGRTMRLRSAENVLQEMQLLYDRYGITLFMPEDDLFTANKKRVLDLLTAIKEMSIPGLEMQFPAALSVNTLDESLIDALMGAGMRILVLAIESGSAYVQKNVIKKNCDLVKARRLASYAKSKGLLVRCYFIFGFPGETKEQMRETVEYAKTLQVDWCVFNIATPLVGSEMFSQFVEMGCIQDCSDAWASTVFDKRQFDTKDISADELNDFAYRANLECNFLHNPNIINGDYTKAIDLFQDIVRKHPFHVIGWYCIWLCHQKLKDEKESMRLAGVISDLVKTDNRAKDMLITYRDLMPNLPGDVA